MGVHGCGHNALGLFMAVHVCDVVWGYMKGSCARRDGVGEKAVPALWVRGITGHCRASPGEVLTGWLAKQG